MIFHYHYISLCPNSCFTQMRDQDYYCKAFHLRCLWGFCLHFQHMSFFCNDLSKKCWKFQHFEFLGRGESDLLQLYLQQLDNVLILQCLIFLVKYLSVYVSKCMFVFLPTKANRDSYYRLLLTTVPIFLNLRIHLLTIKVLQK